MIRIRETLPVFGWFWSEYRNRISKNDSFATLDLQKSLDDWTIWITLISGSRIFDGSDREIQIGYSKMRYSMRTSVCLETTTPLYFFLYFYDASLELKSLLKCVIHFSHNSQQKKLEPFYRYWIEYESPSQFTLLLQHKFLREKFAVLSINIQGITLSVIGILLLMIGCVFWTSEFMCNDCLTECFVKLKEAPVKNAIKRREDRLRWCYSIS